MRYEILTTIYAPYGEIADIEKVIKRIGLFGRSKMVKLYELPEATRERITKTLNKQLEIFSMGIESGEFSGLGTIKERIKC